MHLDSNTHECPQCHQKVWKDDNFCPNCDYDLGKESKESAQDSEALAALILAIIPGMVGIWGVGHFFLGKYALAIFYFILGIVIQVLGGAVGFNLFVYGSLRGSMLVALFFGAIWTTGWLWQSLGAYLLGKRGSWSQTSRTSVL